ncbi:MAG: hypothetical protein HFF09_07105 [Oscillospiraceae bacterium]|nr:hypothetical protein [Oscillospiraceae bacterium]
MKRLIRRLSTAVLAASLLLGMSLPASAALSGDALQTAVAGSSAYVRHTVEVPQVNAIGGEWAVICLARGGESIPQSYWDGYYATVEAYVKEHKGVLHEKKYTEYSRVVLALTAIGADPSHVAGYDLLKPLGDFDKTVWQGVNGPIWALVALDSGGYAMPQNPEAKTQATRQMYVDNILTRQLPDGGWSLSDKGDGEADLTGMALQALAKYRSQSGVQAALDRALKFLSETQGSDGGYTSWSTSNVESTVQVIVGLCELGIDLEDSRFVKNGRTLLDNLLSYRRSDGSFCHTVGGSSNQMASEQGLYALAAALRIWNGKSSLYRMDDVTISTGTDTGLSGRHPDVQKTAVTAPGATFSDVAAHPNRQAIEAMAERRIITGRPGGVFDPNATMTRAEFSAIVVKALGLTPKAQPIFTDVSMEAWYNPYVSTAHGYELIRGVGNGAFDPDGTITRQQAAVLVSRAAVLCGLDTAVTEAAAEEMLSQFSDGMSVVQWARGGVAFCYREGLLDQSGKSVEPNRAITRCEVAEMLYRLLNSAELL